VNSLFVDALVPAFNRPFLFVVSGEQMDRLDDLRRRCLVAAPER